ncbi:MAG: hypothetical protein ACXVWU_11820 [Nocardioides sp.]
MRLQLRRGSQAHEPPADVVARAGLARGDRVLAAARAVDGTWLLGTRTALVLVGTAVETLPWQCVERAEWHRDGERLRVFEVGEYGARRPVHAFHVTAPGSLLAFVRERVTASVVLQRRVVVEGRRGFFVVARRSPVGPADVSFAYEFDAGVDPDDPRVKALAEAGLRAAAEELGLA